MFVLVFIEADFVVESVGDCFFWFNFVIGEVV